MKLRPKGLQVLVKLQTVEEKTDGGIILPSELVDREQNGQFIGVVEEFGLFAFSDWEGLGETLEERCETYGIKVGDTVLFRRYDGVGAPLDEFTDHRLIPSNCILAVVEK